jgi:hypothetical protein
MDEKKEEMLLALIKKNREERDRIFANYSRVSASAGSLVAALEKIKNPLCIDAQSIATDALCKFYAARQNEIQEKDSNGPRVGRLPDIPTS